MGVAVKIEWLKGLPARAGREPYRGVETKAEKRNEQPASNRKSRPRTWSIFR
jgi:hypothetical protein